MPQSTSVLVALTVSCSSYQKILVDDRVARYQLSYNGNSVGTPDSGVSEVELQVDNLLVLGDHDSSKAQKEGEYPRFNLIRVQGG